MEQQKKRKVIKIVVALLATLSLISFGYYWFYMRNVIFSDKASVSAPIVDIGTEKAGTLKEIFVKEGDLIKPYAHIARIDNFNVSSKASGLVIKTNNQIGKLFSPGMPIVTIINPQDMRVLAHIEENNGLSEIRVGQKVKFTVDAFDSKEYFGTVDEIAKSSDESSVAFSISDKREVKQFIVKIKYDVATYPELLNGMSARVWIYKE
ncbi:MAG: efflux RND transporter periplasmic adaptor subunit [Candidatus Peregrinibacteria bacterium]|nr:efflux RND transporter periplasmic adaptor subunit [Candidatus Peregrinibacteria bacterium]